MLRRITLAAAALAVAVSLGAAAPIPVLSQACAASASALAAPATSNSAPVEGRNHAVVIIDTGTEVHRICVSFDSDTITGKQAIELTGANPVFKEFSGMGSFVCKLFDTGREVDNCVGDSTYWVYSRAPAGSTAFTPSEVGVSTAEVRHGDVEGWKWGTEGAPAYAAPEEVCSDVEQATRMPAGTQRPPDERSNDDDSAWPTVVGFVGTLGLVAAVWLIIRRRSV